jgi:hypothetical protein
MWLLWANDNRIQLPVVRQTPAGRRVQWKAAWYFTVIEMLRHPTLRRRLRARPHAGQRTRVVDGRARKTTGHRKPMRDWSVLIRHHHLGYISWAEVEEDQHMIAESAHMKKRMVRKSARGVEHCSRISCAVSCSATVSTSLPPPRHISTLPIQM